MQPATVETLIEEANLQPDIALAIAKAFDIAIDGAKLVTVSVLDDRFAQSAAKTSERFGQLEASIAAAKNWGLALVITLLSLLGGGTAWFFDRQSQALQELETRMDKRFAQGDARLDRQDAQLSRQEARLDREEARLDKMLEQLQHPHSPSPP